MVKEAEEHSEEDKEKRELIDLRNQADQVVFQTEKTIKEHGDKVPEEDKKAIEDAVEELKKIKDEGTKDEIKAKMETPTQASHKLAEEMYKQTQAQQQAQQSEQTAEPEQPAESSKPSDEEDVVDADFEEVK